MAALLTLEEALALVRERARPLAPERVPLAAAAGRVLAEPAHAATDLPPFDSSAMDGYAVRSADTPGRLRVVGAAAAGRPAAAAVGAGDAVAIATGGVIPDGADAVVPIENTVGDGGVVEVGAAARGAHIRTRGRDVRAGDEVVPAGTRLAPRHVGALAAAGVASLVCARRPTVTVLATGTELRRPGEPLAHGEIYESNGAMLISALRLAGADASELEPVADDEAAHEQALARALAADVVITTGGVSVGHHDLVRRVAARLGVEEVFWRVAVKPGKPVAFGVRGPTLVFGLPGNPVSTLVGFEVFVRPVLRALEGERDPGPRWRDGSLAAPVARNAQRDELVRAHRSAAGLEALRDQESHMIVRSAAADALVLVPRGEGSLAAGSAVRWLPLS